MLHISLFEGVDPPLRSGRLSDSIGVFMRAYTEIPALGFSATIWCENGPAVDLPAAPAAFTRRR
jgi:hypothetical protein